MNLERQQFRSDQASYDADVTSLKALIGDAKKSVDSLMAQLQTEEVGAKQEQLYMTKMLTNAAHGIASQMRVAEVQREFTSAQSRYLATLGNVWGGERSLADLDRQLAHLESSRRTALLTEAQNTAVELEKVEGQLKAAGEKFAVIGGARSGLYMHAGDEADVTIFRTKDGHVNRLEATFDSDVLPDDTVEVDLRPGRWLGATTPQPMLP